MRASWLGAMRMRSWVAAASLALVSCVAQASVTLTDDRGVTLTLPRPPQRIVTLLPSLTETVCELGACHRLVGVDDFSNWPARAAELPRVGGVEDANIERIVSLKPDLVLLGTTSRAIGRLQQLDIPVLGLDIKKLSDVQRVLLKVSQALSVPGAQEAWQRMENGIAQAAASVPPARKGQRVYFEIGSDGYAASESSHIGELLTRLGARNIVPGHLGTVPRLNPEFVVRADPQLIMIASSGAGSLAQRPGWSRIRAVQSGRVCAFSPAQNDVIMRPGPRLHEAARIMAGCLRGTP